MADWKPFSSIAGEISAVPAESVGAGVTPVEMGTTVPCPNCGRLVEPDHLVYGSGKPICCGFCKSDYLQRIREGTDVKEFRYAGFWIRFVARFIDGLIVGAISFVFAFFLGLAIASIGAEENPEAIIGLTLVFYGFIFAAAFGYFVFFTGNPKYQATLGKMAVGLKVSREDGDRVTYGRAAGRMIGDLISSTFTFNNGYLIAAFDEEKRALHDHIAGTRVIYKDS